MTYRSAIALFGLVLGLGACASPRVENPAPIEEAIHRPGETPAEYRIDIGDRLLITFYRYDYLDREVFVRADGRITLPLGGEVVAIGRTPREVAGLVNAAYARELLNPNAQVTVLDTPNRRVFVLGEVRRPGGYEMTGRLTALQAIASSEGFTDVARDTQVVVMRERAAGERRLYVINLATALDGTAPEQDIPLQSGDLVFVPPSAGGQWVRFVDVWLRRGNPFNMNLGAGLTYEIGGGNN